MMDATVSLDHMNEISVDELYDLYIDAVARYTSELRNRSDEEIGYELFEEFDIGAISYLHEDNLRKLQVAGYIDNKILTVSKEIRVKWLALQDKKWTFEEIRTEKEWQDLFELCELILRQSKEHFRRPNPSPKRGESTRH
jgi:hypothetical protein